MALTNWAGNLQYRAKAVHRPGSVDELREIVAQCDSVRALGTRHSFNDLADTDGELVWLGEMAGEIEIASDGGSVAVGASVAYGELSRALEQQGLALRNLASLPHISVAGACATATHGSGIGNRNLSAAVIGMEMVTADGGLESFSREGDGAAFSGMVVHLGALGVATRVTLETVPSYDVCQTVYERLPFAALERQYDAVAGAGYSVSLFTDWQSETVNQVWRKRLANDEKDAPSEAEWFGAHRADGERHPLPGVSPENCTPQMGVAAPWHERLPHFRYEYTPSHGEELQSEYFVAREDAYAALRAVAELRERLRPLLYISEIRTVAADELWLSPCYERESVGIHFTWRSEWAGVMALLPEIERRLEPFAPRPHWAKLFTMPSKIVQERYEMLPRFVSIAERWDPSGKFANRYLREVLGVGAGTLATKLRT